MFVNGGEMESNSLTMSSYLLGPVSGRASPFNSVYKEEELLEVT